MGYGHLRAGAAVAERLGVDLAEVDRAPWVEPWEERLWRRSRLAYEWMSRLATVPGRPAAPLLAAMTRLPPAGEGASGGRWACRSLDRLIRRGLGARLAESLGGDGRALVSTFYAPALAVARRGLAPVACVVTDSDLHRVWVAAEPDARRVLYLAPSASAARRLVAYGVAPGRVVETGFPLPDGLLGGEDLAVLRPDLRERLARLDPTARWLRAHRAELRQRLGGEPAADPDGSLRLTFAVGGAGAQATAARDLLRSCRDLLRDGRIRLALVAGTRPEVARRFAGWTRDAGLGDAVEVVAAPDFPTYWACFNDLLRRTDLLWTKPSELVFYAALGLAVALDRPLGDHEAHNRRWLLAEGAALDAPAPRHAAPWLEQRLADGGLAAAAWRGFLSLPRAGLYRAVEVLAREGFTPP